MEDEIRSVKKLSMRYTEFQQNWTKNQWSYRMKFRLVHCQ